MSDEIQQLQKHLDRLKEIDAAIPNLSDEAEMLAVLMELQRIDLWARRHAPYDVEEYEASMRFDSWDGLFRGSDSRADIDPRWDCCLRHSADAQHKLAKRGAQLHASANP